MAGALAACTSGEGAPRCVSNKEAPRTRDLSPRACQWARAVREDFLAGWWDLAQVAEDASVSGGEVVLFVECERNSGVGSGR